MIYLEVMILSIFVSKSWVKVGKKPKYQVETSCIHVTEMLDD